MSEKRILVADADPQTLLAFTEALPTWQVQQALTGPIALTAMKEHNFDVIVASLNLAEIDGPQLLNRVRGKYPNTIRIIIAAERDRDRVMKEVLGAHQYLTKPCNQTAIKNALERSVSLDKFIANESIRELVGRVRTLPTIPTIYLELRAALKSDSADPKDVGAIIAKDMAMMTKLLQVTNSAYFGLPRKITDPSEAVNLLGFEAVKSIVVAVKMLGSYDRIKPTIYSVDRLWKHSMLVAQNAKKIAQLQSHEPTLAENSYAAGLMHDLGKVVLAFNFDEQYEGAQTVARNERMPLWIVEKDIFGASHGEVGAYLLGLWGMPVELLEAAALHHQPFMSVDEQFTALTAVHAANALVHEVNPEQDGYVASVLDDAYLERVGCSGEVVEQWRHAVLGSATSRARLQEEAKQGSQTGTSSFHRRSEHTQSVRRAQTETAHEPAHVEPAPRQTQPVIHHDEDAPSHTEFMRPSSSRKPVAAAGESQAEEPPAPMPVPVTFNAPLESAILPTEVPFWQNPRVIAAFAAAVLFALSISIAKHNSNKDEPDSATPTTAAPADPTNAPPTTADQANAKADNQVASADSSGADMPTNDASLALVHPDGFPNLKLQAIFYSEQNPSAIINGQVVHPNQPMNGIGAGVTVWEIKPDHVLLQFGGQTKSLALK